MKISNPAIPLGSVIVVIGANGYVALEACQKLLEAGYKVRGTVRDLERSAWMHEIFDKDWPGQLELVRVQDFGSDGAFDEAFRGAAGVVYVSIPTVIDSDPAKAIEPIINLTLNALEAAAHAKVQRFVLCSSSKAVESTSYDQPPHELTAKTFNHEALHKARDKSTAPKAWEIYTAGRTAAELAFWSWVKDNDPPFVANCVVPDGNFGRVLSLGYSSHELSPSVKMLKHALAGQWNEVFPYLAYYVDVEDTARLLVAAVALPSVQNERIFAYFGQSTWNDLRHKVRELFRHHSDIVLGEDLAITGRDLSTAHEPIQRAKEILQEIGQSGFVSEDDMLRNFVGSVYGVTG